MVQSSNRYDDRMIYLSEGLSAKAESFDEGMIRYRHGVGFCQLSFIISIHSLLILPKLTQPDAPLLQTPIAAFEYIICLLAV